MGTAAIKIVFLSATIEHIRAGSTVIRCDQLRRYRPDQIIDAREVGLQQEAQHEKVRCRCGDRSFVYVVGRTRW
jgi:hypothetical protein